MLPDGDLSFYTGQASHETRDEVLLPLWEKLQKADFPPSFTYEQWLVSLRRAALPCGILDDIDALQGWQAVHAADPEKSAFAAALLDQKSVAHEMWQNMKGQAQETKQGQIAELSDEIRGLYGQLPHDFRERVCLPQALEGRLAEMEANIHARFALNAAALNITGPRY